MQLIVMSARPSGPLATQVLSDLYLPHLSRLLQSASVVSHQRGDPHLKTPLPEVQLALGYGLATAADGLIPWGAWDAHKLHLPQADTAGWAHAIPCHLSIATDYIRILPLSEIRLDASTSEQLCKDLDVWFSEQGVRFHYLRPWRFLVSASLFRDTPTVSFDRVHGKMLDPWMPLSPESRELRKLHNEAQLFLTQHTINQQRENQGMPTINALWFCGSGFLPAAPTQPKDIFCQEELIKPDMLDDEKLWVNRFARMDQDLFAPLMHQAFDLSLCSENNIKTWRYSPKWGAVKRYLTRSILVGDQLRSIETRELTKGR